MPLDAALKKIDAAPQADVRYIADNNNDPVTAAAVGFIRHYKDRQGVLAKAFGKPEDARRKVSSELERLGLAYNIEDYCLQALQSYVEEHGDLPANTSKVIASAQILDRLPDPEFESGHRVVFAINEEGPAVVGASEVAISFGPNGTCTSSKAGKIDERFGAITKKTLWILIDFPEQSELDGIEAQQQAALAAVAQAIENPAAAAENFDAIIEQIQQLGESTDIDVQATIELVTNIVEMAVTVEANPAALESPAVQKIAEAVIEQLSGDTNIPPAIVEAVAQTVETLVAAQQSADIAIDAPAVAEAIVATPEAVTPVTQDVTAQAVQPVELSAADIVATVDTLTAEAAASTPALETISAEQPTTIEMVAADATTLTVETQTLAEPASTAVETPVIAEATAQQTAEVAVVETKMDNAVTDVAVDAPAQDTVSIETPVIAETSIATPQADAAVIDLAAQASVKEAVAVEVADVANVATVHADTPEMAEVSAVKIDAPVNTETTVIQTETPAIADAIVAKAETPALADVTVAKADTPIVAEASQHTVTQAVQTANISLADVAKPTALQTSVVTPVVAAIAANQSVSQASVTSIKAAAVSTTTQTITQTAASVTQHRADPVTRLETAKTIPAAAVVAQVQAIAKQLPAEHKTPETKKVLQQVTNAIKSGEKITPAIQKQAEKIIAKLPNGPAKQQLASIVAKAKGDEKPAAAQTITEKLKSIFTAKKAETSTATPHIVIPTKHDNQNTQPERKMEGARSTQAVAGGGERVRPDTTPDHTSDHRPVIGGAIPRQETGYKEYTPTTGFQPDPKHTPIEVIVTPIHPHGPENVVIEEPKDEPEVSFEKPCGPCKKTISCQECFAGSITPEQKEAENQLASANAKKFFSLDY